MDDNEDVGSVIPDSTSMWRAASWVGLTSIPTLTKTTFEMEMDTSALEKSMLAFKQSLMNIEPSTSKVKGGCMKQSTSPMGIGAKHSDSRTMVWVDTSEPGTSKGKDELKSFMSKRSNQMDAQLKNGGKLNAGETDDTKEPTKELQKDVRFMEPSRSKLPIARKDSKMRGKTKKDGGPKKEGS